MAPDIRAWFPRPQSLALSAAADAPCVMFHHGEEQGLLHLLRHGFRTGREESSPAPSVEDFALDIRSLSFSYGQRVILRDVTLSVRPGEICGLLGPNGSGKSTLFRCCMGFLHPEKGSVHVRGTNIAHMRPAQLARHVAYVPQEHRQPFPFLVRDMVLMGRSPHMEGWFRLTEKDRSIAAEAMARVGIGHLADSACNQLSGGQRQLVLIARAMAQKTPLILLDEPTSALDFSNQLAVWNALREVARQGVAILVCCHDPNHILWFCDRAAVMHQGVILTEGPARTALTAQVLRHVYGPDCVRISVDGMDMVRPKETDGRHASRE